MPTGASFCRSVYYFEKNNRNTYKHKFQVSVCPRARVWGRIAHSTYLGADGAWCARDLEEKAPGAGEMTQRADQVIRRAIKAFAPVAAEMQVRRQEHLHLSNAGKKPPKFEAGTRVLILYRRNYKKQRPLFEASTLSVDWTLHSGG